VIRFGQPAIATGSARAPGVPKVDTFGDRETSTPPLGTLLQEQLRESNDVSAECLGLLRAPPTHGLYRCGRW
jgi:hypothetical protein